MLRRLRYVAVADPQSAQVSATPTFGDSNSALTLILRVSALSTVAVGTAVVQPRGGGGLTRDGRRHRHDCDDKGV